MREPDVRDERLRERMDRALRDLRPDERIERVVRRGRRLQVARVAFASASVAVFVAVVAWAGAVAGRDAPDDAQSAPPSTSSAPPAGALWATFASGEAPWSFDHPLDWDIRTYAEGDPSLIVNYQITTVANGPIPEGGPFRPDDRGLPRALGDTGAVVSIERFWSHETGEIGAGEFGPGAFSPDRSNPGWTWVERARCEGTLCWHVIEWLGPDVSDEDRVAVERVADSVGLADIDRWTETDGVRTTLHDEDAGLTVTYPNDGWTVADENLTPWLTQPHEILSLGTAAMPVSHDADDELRVLDAPVAPLALAALGPADAFVSVQDGGKAFPGSRYVRPESFRGAVEPSNLAVDAPFDAYWIPFTDAGRGFYLFVAIGNEASPHLVDRTWAVADSLRFLASPA